MSIEGASASNINLKELTDTLNGLTNKYTLDYSDLSTSSWSDAGGDMYDGGNILSIDGTQQSIWETTNTTEKKSISWGNYTFKTNPSSTLLYVENFQGSEFKISGDTGSDGSGDVDFGELDGMNGLHAYYHQIYNASDPSINQLVVTDANNPSFTASTNSNNDGFTLSGLDNGDKVLYILFAGTSGYHYTLDDLRAIVAGKSFLVATNDNTPKIITDANVTITIKDDANTTLQTVTTSLVDGNYSAVLTELADGEYLAETGDKGMDIAGNSLSYSSMAFLVDTVISAPTLDLNATSDSGDSNSDNITNHTNVVLSGVAEAGTKVELNNGSTTPLATTYTHSDGNYTLDVAGLSDGNYTLQALTTDAAGNSKSAELNVTIDTFGDSLINISMDTASDTGNSNSDQITGDTTPTIVTDRATTLTILDESNVTMQTVDTSSNAATLSALRDGVYTVEGGDRGTDIAGNPLSYNTTTIQIDTSSPTLTSPTELDSNSTITVNSLHVYNTATADASEVTYTLGGTDANYFTIDSITGIITLADITTSGKTYNVTVSATDVVGNSDTYNITITPQVITPLNTAKIVKSNMSATAVFGDYIVVGDRLDDTLASDAGAVYVYKKSLDGSLKEIAKLTASNGTSYDNFGTSVAINGNYIVVGANVFNTAYLYKISATDVVTEISVMTAEDGLTGSFGVSVAIDGSYIVIGANTKSGNASYEGAAYLYKINSDDTTTEVTKIKAFDPEYDDYFGQSVSISGDKIVVGAYREDAAGFDAGAAYVYKVETNESVTALAKITGSDTVSGDNFGCSVSINQDKIVVGAYLKDLQSNAYEAGEAYLFTIDNSDKITQIAKLTASDLNSNSNYDYFGKSVSINGEYISVGADGKGATYLYKIDNEDSVTELAKITASDNSTFSLFGKSVAIDGKNISIVSDGGVYLYDVFADKPYIPAINKSISIVESLSSAIYSVPFSTDIDSSEIFYTLSGDDADKFTITDKQINANSVLDFESPTDANQDNSYMVTLNLQDIEGRVNSYDLNISISDGIYFEEAKLKADDADYNDKLGTNIAIDGNYIVTGVPNEDANGEYDAGSVYVFKKETDGTMTQVSKLTVFDGSSSDYFGSSVAMDSSYIVVGAKNADGVVANSGAAYLFKIQSDGTTTQIAKLTADDGSSSDYFGYSVSISGDYIVVGAYGNDDNGSSSGSVYIYKKDSSDNVAQIAKIIGSDTDSYDYFGSAVSIDGNLIAVGAYGKNSNAYLFKVATDDTVSEVSKYTTTDSKFRFGYAIALDSGYIVVSNYGYDNAYLFKIASDNSTSQIARLETTNTATFGYSIAISGDNILVGDDGAETVTLFVKDSADNVSELTKISSKSSDDNFGIFVDIDGTNIVIGANVDDTTHSDSGAVYLYIKDTNQP